MEPLSPRDGADIRMQALQKTFEIVQELARNCPARDDEMCNRCIYCDNPGVSACAQCRTARYCSRGCQKKDWPIHQMLCVTFSEFTASKRPSPHHARGIIFPADDEKPKFIWVEQYIEGTYLFPIIDNLLGPYARYSNMITDMNSVLEQAGHTNTGHGLLMVGLHEHPLPGVPVNRSLRSLGKPGHMKTWFGNQIIVGRMQNEIGTRGITIEDVSFRDFRHAVDLYQHHPLNLCVVNPIRYTLPVMPGVIIQCDGTRGRHGLTVPPPRMEVVTIPRHCTKSSVLPDGIRQDVCAGLLKVELQWSYRRYPARMEWLDDDIKSHSLRNMHARNLVYQMRRGGEGYFLHSIREAGTVVVFDHGGAPIQPAHIYAVNHYVDEVLKANAEEDTRDVPATCPTMDGFKAFWTSWKQEMIERGNDIDHVESPYSGEGSSKESEDFLADVFESTLHRVNSLAWRVA